MPVDDVYTHIVSLLRGIVTISADYAGEIPLPYARYIELGDHYTFFTRSVGDTAARQVVSHNQFQISVFANTRDQARSLGNTIMRMIDDYVPSYSDGRVMLLEPISAIFLAEPHSGPSTPTVFHRAITFALTEQRTI